MKYELQQLDEIISVNLCPTYFIKQKQRRELLNNWQRIVTQENERIRKQMMMSLFNCEHELRINCYVQQHQLSLIKLVDRCYSYLVPGALDFLESFPSLKIYTPQYQSILDCLNNLLLFIEENFPRYFNRQYKIPDKLLSNTAMETKPLLKKMTPVLNNSGIDQRFILIICMPLEKSIRTGAELSYHSFEYLQQYRIEMQQLAKKAVINEEEVCELLIRLNYNEGKFFRYYINRLIMTTDKEMDIDSRIEYYSRQLKAINQHAGILLQPFCYQLPGISEQISNWLSEEIYFLERTYQLYNTPVQNHKSTLPVTAKVHTKLSVAHLSLAVKLLLETGVIKNKNAAELMRMVARSFRTEKCEQISEDSLRNKAYNIESSAVEGMKDVIVCLLNAARKY